MALLGLIRFDFAQFGQQNRANTRQAIKQPSGSYSFSLGEKARMRGFKLSSCTKLLGFGATWHD